MLNFRRGMECATRPYLCLSYRSWLRVKLCGRAHFRLLSPRGIMHSGSGRSSRCNEGRVESGRSGRAGVVGRRERHSSRSSRQMVAFNKTGLLSCRTYTTNPQRAHTVCGTPLVRPDNYSVGVTMRGGGVLSGRFCRCVCNTGGDTLRETLGADLLERNNGGGLCHGIRLRQGLM